MATPDTPPKRQTPEDKRFLGSVVQDFGPFLTLGLQLAISVGAFFFIGYWMDGLLGTWPWCTIGGAFIGALGGLIKFFREATALGKKADEKMKDRHEAR